MNIIRFTSRVDELRTQHDLAVYNYFKVVLDIVLYCNDRPRG